MMHGTWDANALNTINDNAVDVIGRYIDAGKGVITGHDTLGHLMGKKFGLGRLTEKFNLVIGKTPGMPVDRDLDSNEAWAYMSSKVKITKKGFLTQFPWNLGPVGTILNVPLTHTTSNGAKGNTWIEFVEGHYYGDPGNYIVTDEQAAAKLPNVNIKYYLTTWNNTAMIQTGHSSGESTEDERKVLANTLFYLKQLTHKTEILDNSARDIADPNKPENIVYKIDEQGNNIIEFRKPEDNRKYI